MKIDVRGGPGRSRGVPGGRFRPKTQENRARQFLARPFSGTSSERGPEIGAWTGFRREPGTSPEPGPQIGACTGFRGAGADPRDPKALRSLFYKAPALLPTGPQKWASDMVLKHPGAAQTPKTTDFQPNPKPGSFKRLKKS